MKVAFLLHLLTMFWVVQLSHLLIIPDGVNTDNDKAIKMEVDFQAYLWNLLLQAVEEICILVIFYFFLSSSWNTW